MTQLTPRLKIAILKSKLPDKAMLSAIADAEARALAAAQQKEPAAKAPESPAPKPAARRTYSRRDMKAEK